MLDLTNTPGHATAGPLKFEQLEGPFASLIAQLRMWGSVVVDVLDVVGQKRTLPRCHQFAGRPPPSHYDDLPRRRVPGLCPQLPHKNINYFFPASAAAKNIEFIGQWCCRCAKSCVCGLVFHRSATTPATAATEIEPGLRAEESRRIRLIVSLYTFASNLQQVYPLDAGQINITIRLRVSCDMSSQRVAGHLINSRRRESASRPNALQTAIRASMDVCFPTSNSGAPRCLTRSKAEDIERQHRHCSRVYGGRSFPKWG